MHGKPAVTDERFLVRVGAVFDSREAVDQAAQTIADRMDVPSVQVRVLEPGSAAASRKLEPESSRIAGTIVRSHVIFGGLGALLGGVLAGILIFAQLRLFSSSPWATLGALVALGAVAGMLLAGLASLRPDRDRLTMKLEEALRAGRWGLVVHLRDGDRLDEAAALLRQQDGEVFGAP